MVRAMRLLEERLALVDVVIEVLDARLPRYEHNPEARPDRRRAAATRVLGARGPRRTVRNAQMAGVVCCTKMRRRRARRSTAACNPASIAPARSSTRFVAGRGPSRAMVIGIPNTGKSSLINGLAKRNAAKTENKAGVTRQLRWFRVNPQLEVMDTPGILVAENPDRRRAVDARAVPARCRANATIPKTSSTRFADMGAPHVPKLDVPDLERFARDARLRATRRRGRRAQRGRRVRARVQRGEVRPHHVRRPAAGSPPP